MITLFFIFCGLIMVADYRDYIGHDKFDQLTERLFGK